MTSPILITGGTGRIGSHVVPLLRAAGHPVRVLSRRGGDPADGVEYRNVDLLDGTGLDAALDGVDTVLHLAGGTNGKGDGPATRNLAQAAARAGVRHLVNVSVIGAGQVPLAYLDNKLATEQAVADSGVPWTNVRVAQVHDLILTMLRAMAKLPVLPAPGGLRAQPVDVRDVAAHLATLALAPPAGQVPDLAGPKVYELGELGRGYLAAVGKRRLLLPIRIPGKAGRAYRAGANLALEGAHFGTRTWEDFLAERLGSAHAAESGRASNSPAAER